ncbi:DUF2637 domain-containing protein [Streptacidiphilus griseoplanus]|uniref:DUF2637 domain-containing protein n=1 Tax=Peterkaempfera griseoplana TaxID=66896 RepID=UPI0006E18E26|nr:DUF2637 domain-containing protein [Peterkaempfera griseoplana]
MSRHLPRLDAVLVQAVIAGALSFAHLHDIAEAAGQHGWKAWAYPISVDLLLVAAWRRMRTLRANGASARAAWTWFAIALSASLGANIATAGLLDLGNVPALLRIVVAGWPAVAFFGGTLLAHTPTDAPAAATEPTDETPSVYSAAPAPAGIHEEAPRPEQVAPPERLPELPPAVPEPAPVDGPAPAAPTVPTALVDHARKIADAHRARTGTEIDAATLRARLGVNALLADAIAAQLT